MLQKHFLFKDELGNLDSNYTLHVYCGGGDHYLPLNILSSFPNNQSPGFAKYIATQRKDYRATWPMSCR